MSDEDILYCERCRMLLPPEYDEDTDEPRCRWCHAPAGAKARQETHEPGREDRDEPDAPELIEPLPAEITRRRRWVLVGGPRCGKSTFARRLRAAGIPTYCTDPLSLVKEPERDVTYLPEDLEWSQASEYVAREWLTLPEPWCVDGVATARALRKACAIGGVGELAGIWIGLFFAPVVEQNLGQQAMTKGVRTIWDELRSSLSHLVVEVGEWTVR